MSKRAISKARLKQFKDMKFKKWTWFCKITYSAESSVDVIEGNGCGGGGVSYDEEEEEETSVDATRDRLIDDGTRLYKSGVNDRTGVENSNLGGGGGGGGGLPPVNDRPANKKKRKREIFKN